MIIYENTEFQIPENTAICIGKFDGIHVGHQALLSKCCYMKETYGYAVLMISLVPVHTNMIFSQQEKRYIAKQYGVDYYISLPLTKEIMDIDAERFIEKILVKRCHCKYIAVGQDFRFGKQREGDVSFLKNKAERYGYQIEQIQKVVWKRERISSSRIRDLIENGEIGTANTLLGRAFFFLGKVSYGAQIGHKIEIPTVNVMPLPYKLLPPKGVYASRVLWKGKKYQSITNVGCKPTVKETKDVNIETNLFEFDEKLYGETVCIELYEFIRPEMQFTSLMELKHQIEQDTRIVKDFFQNSLV